MAFPHLSAPDRTKSAPVKPHRSALRTAPIYGVRGAVRCEEGGQFRTYQPALFPHLKGKPMTCHLSPARIEDTTRRVVQSSGWTTAELLADTVATLEGIAVEFARPAAVKIIAELKAKKKAA